ncbi:hypothetical protein M947_05490 [Sulfurimonas hongkongensis]|uniref:Porin n=1 Tax=Sulfurimonas hongkongensis TaxID=1172190 RepID=T0JMR1_9BACT|nr:OprD family outer membrane porin [Sulfurimonas hongkongensis]EQB39446.1 hypothetical protein M947_05490 [Sulfurimonas hongkongensis]
MKKGIVLSLSAVVATQVMGANIEVGGKDAGELTMQFKAMTVLSDKENGFAPSNGTGYLVKLKYETADILTQGLKIGVATYINGDAGLTEWDENNAADGYNKGAYGMVTDAGGASKGVLGELYLSYKHQYFDATLGRQILKTPLTQIQTSLTPNFYEAYMLGTEVIDGLRLTAGHITKMSLGSRAAPDAGVIGENTGTAGVGFANSKLVSFGGNMEQAKFYNMGIIAGLGKETDGRSMIGATYTGVKNLSVDLWMYRSADIANDFYGELKYGMPVAKGIKLNMNAQYLVQKDTGDSLAGERDFNMLGAKVALGNKKWGAFIAYNKSGDAEGTKGQYFNAWGADPAYTSSIFSRNAYRTDVSAYKVGVHYVFMKGLKLMVNYADYGKSKSTLGGATTTTPNTALEDATEIDTVLVYKPNKEWMFKVFNAIRTSEYNGRVIAKTPERKMNHFRAIASYTF